MTVTPTIDLGQLITIVVLVLGFVGAWFTFQERLRNLEELVKETLGPKGRMARIEERVITQGEHIQRVIGKLESGAIERR